MKAERGELIKLTKSFSIPTIPDTFKRANFQSSTTEKSNVDMTVDSNINSNSSKLLYNGVHGVRKNKTSNNSRKRKGNTTNSTQNYSKFIRLSKQSNDSNMKNGS